MSKQKHKISIDEWEACKKYFNYRCAYCGEPFEDYYDEKEKDFVKEHYVNLGSNRLDNCVPACNSCNLSKSSKEFEEWYTKEKPFFTSERYWKIYKWINHDYKKYIHATTIEEVIIYNTNEGQLEYIKNDNITLTKYLAKELKESGRILSRVARRIGISPEAFRYRIKNNFISVKELLAICNILELPLIELHKVFPEY